MPEKENDELTTASADRFQGREKTGSKKGTINTSINEERGACGKCKSENNNPTKPVQEKYLSPYLIVQQLHRVDLKFCLLCANPLHLCGVRKGERDIAEHFKNYLLRKHN